MDLEKFDFDKWRNLIAEVKQQSAIDNNEKQGKKLWSSYGRTSSVATDPRSRSPVTGWVTSEGYNSKVFKYCPLSVVSEANSPTLDIAGQPKGKSSAMMPPSDGQNFFAGAIWNDEVDTPKSASQERKVQSRERGNTPSDKSELPRL